MYGPSSWKKEGKKRGQPQWIEGEGGGGRVEQVVANMIDVQKSMQQC